MVGAGRYRPALVRRVTATALAVAALAAGCGGGGDGAADERAGQARQVGADAGLSEEVQDVLALAAGAVGATYTVVYVTPADGERPERRVVVAQRPPDRRIDVVEGAVTDATILLDGTSYQCRNAEAQWNCTTLVGDVPAVGAFDPASIRTAVEALAASADAFDFAVEHRTMLGVDATCLVTTLRPGAADDPSLGAAGTLCLSPEGAVLLAEGPAERLEAVEYRAEVDDAALVLPAQPIAAGTPGG